MSRSSWIDKGSRNARFRLSPQYLQEVKNFIEFAISNSANVGEEILCPCVKCKNRYWYSKDYVEEHLVVDGFHRDYVVWDCHGESSSSQLVSDVNPSHVNLVGTDEANTNDGIHNMLNEMYGAHENEGVEDTIMDEHTRNQSVETVNIRRLMEDADQELYQGSQKLTRLKFLLRLYHIKCLYKLSDKGFTVLLELLKESFPAPNSLPNSLYETKKIIKELGLDYDRIDACPRDCMLFWKGSASLDKCEKCSSPRYKSGGKIPIKTLRHFPLIPRLQRLYMSSKTSADMQWHHEDRIDDGRLRHPADSKAWKDFDKLYPDFCKEPRNVKLGLASDGFNPFGNMSSTHSTWPVVVIPYNLPPWLCMKPSNMILTLLIPGPKQPGNDIDVYLQPLIDELKILWDGGVPAYDVHKKENFVLRASLMWTINDFPAYGNLSGWSTKGALACPICNEDCCSRWQKNGRKYCYLGHRRFLPKDHPYRRNKRSFDGHEEHRGQPKLLSGCDHMEQLWNVQFPDFGKESTEKGVKKRKKPQLPLNWKKKSIFFDLPYWRYNLVRHNLDVMHIEKNVCESIIFTLLNVIGKSKDNLNARLDLKDMKIRPDLQPKRTDVGNKTILPPTHYSMSNKEKDAFCRVLSGVKVPDGYAGNIARCALVRERMLSGMKSHDCHIMMQQLLPVAVRNVLPKKVVAVFVKVCGFFRDLCSKVGTEDGFKSLHQNIAETMCDLEKLFPPNFFDVMVHLMIHLGHEASIGGPVHYRWMYPIERFLKQLKDYVRNRSRPEGSIAEGYIADECLTFISRYFEGVETKSNRPSRNEGSLGYEDPYNMFSRIGRPLGKCEKVRLDNIEMEQLHRYVLFHYDGILEYRNMHRNEIKRELATKSRPWKVDDMHNKDFPNWFRKHIFNLRENGVEVSEIIKWLAVGPNVVARIYSGYIINGIRFHTKALERSRKTQNSGVFVTALTSKFASRKDTQPIDGQEDYFGVLTQVIEVEYSDEIRVMLFRCDWVDPKKGVRIDEMGFTTVNFKHLLYSGQGQFDEPFVFPSQTEQVFYVHDDLSPDWDVAIRSKIRDIYDIGGQDDGVQDEAYTQSNLTQSTHPSYPIVDCEGDEDVNWIRSGLPGIEVDNPIDVES